MGGISAVLSRRGTRTPLGALLLPMRITVSWFRSLRPAHARTLAAPSRHRLGDSRWPWKHKRRASVKFHDRDYLDVVKSINRGILACLSAEDERHRQTIRSGDGWQP